MPFRTAVICMTVAGVCAVLRVAFDKIHGLQKSSVQPRRWFTPYDLSSDHAVREIVLGDAMRWSGPLLWWRVSFVTIRSVALHAEKSFAVRVGHWENAVVDNATTFVKDPRAEGETRPRSLRNWQESKPLCSFGAFAGSSGTRGFGLKAHLLNGCSKTRKDRTMPTETWE